MPGIWYPQSMRDLIHILLARIWYHLVEQANEDGFSSQAEVIYFLVMGSWMEISSLLF